MKIDNAQFQPLVLAWQRSRCSTVQSRLVSEFLRPLCRMVVLSHPHHTRIVDDVVEWAVLECLQRLKHFREEDGTAFACFYRIARNVSRMAHGKDAQRVNAEWGRALRHAGAAEYRAVAVA